MRPYGNHRLLSSTAEFIGEAVTIPDCYTMLTGGFPYVLKNGISHVKGELYLVSDEYTMNRLDALEGVPDHYVRHETCVALVEDFIPGISSWEPYESVIMYVASPSTEKQIREHKDYFNARIVTPNDDNVLEWQGSTFNTTRKAS